MISLKQTIPICILIKQKQAVNLLGLSSTLIKKPLMLKLCQTTHMPHNVLPDCKKNISIYQNISGNQYCIKYADIQIMHEKNLAERAKSFTTPEISASLQTGTLVYKHMHINCQVFKSFVS